MNEVSIALCKCKESKKTYGVRFERFGNNVWKYTWAFPIKEDTARREGYTTNMIHGEIEPDVDYPGCPYCGANHFILCECGKLNCNVVTGNIFTCEWCGSTGTLIEGHNFNITAGGDR